MTSVTSEVGSDHQSEERCVSYTPSADISESEFSSRGSLCRQDKAGEENVSASSSRAFSPTSAPGSSGIPLPFAFPVIGGKDVVARDEKQHKCGPDLSEIEMMKERFAKLLLGEDMSGGRKGVCTALALSNAITNLSATVFGELWRLEPLAPQKKSMWCREMEWLLSVSDSIVELVPSIQPFPGGGTYEVMATRPRSDLYVNLPALKKLDALLISILDGFRETEFWYVDRGIVVDDREKYTSAVTSGRLSIRQEEKWWLPYPKVPPKGLSDDMRKRLQQCRDCTNQILKAAMTINSNVLAEMEIPDAYLETLPKVKSPGRNPYEMVEEISEDDNEFVVFDTLYDFSANGRDCLGDTIYRYITADQFSPGCLLNCLDLSSEHHTLNVANRIEAAVYVWKMKERKKDPNLQKAKRKTWGGKVKGLVVDGEKNHFLAQRAENLLHSLRIRFPGLPQTALDMNKIQYNKDVGQSILESYSRVMESLAFNTMARIDDVLFVDDATRRAAAEPISIFNRGGLNGLPIQKKMSPSPFSIQHTPYTSPFATPTFCSSPPLASSPPRKSHSPTHNKNSVKTAPGHKFDQIVPTDWDKVCSYAGDLSARRVSWDAPERD